MLVMCELGMFEKLSTGIVWSSRFLDAVPLCPWQPLENTARPWPSTIRFGTHFSQVQRMGKKPGRPSRRLTGAIEYPSSGGCHACTTKAEQA